MNILEVSEFRAKRIDNGEWVYGSLIKMDEQGSLSFIFPFFKGASTMSCERIVANNMVAIDIGTVGQFTGFIDSRGTKAYSGSIVMDGEDSGFIEYGECGFEVHFDGYFYPLGEFDSCDLEVIGNKWDNPEW